MLVHMGVCVCGGMFMRLSICRSERAILVQLKLAANLLIGRLLQQ